MQEKTKAVEMQGKGCMQEVARKEEEKPRESCQRSQGGENFEKDIIVSTNTYWREIKYIGRKRSRRSVEVTW